MPEGPPGLGGHFRLAGLPRVVWGGRCPLGRCPLVAGRPMIPVAAVCPAPGGGRRGEPIAAADEVPVGPSLIVIAVHPAPSVSCSVCPRVQVRPGDVRPVISGRHETRPVQIGLTPAALIGQGVAGPFVGATSRRGLRRAIFPGRGSLRVRRRGDRDAVVRNQIRHSGETGGDPPTPSVSLFLCGRAPARERHRPRRGRLIGRRPDKLAGCWPPFEADRPMKVAGFASPGPLSPAQPALPAGSPAPAGATRPR